MWVKVPLSAPGLVFVMAAELVRQSAIGLGHVKAGQWGGAMATSLEGATAPESAARSAEPSEGSSGAETGRAWELVWGLAKGSKSGPGSGSSLESA